MNTTLAGTRTTCAGRIQLVCPPSADVCPTTALSYHIHKLSPACLQAHTCTQTPHANAGAANVQSSNQSSKWTSCVKLSTTPPTRIPTSPSPTTCVATHQNLGIHAGACNGVTCCNKEHTCSWEYGCQHGRKSGRTGSSCAKWEGIYTCWSGRTANAWKSDVFFACIGITIGGTALVLGAWALALLQPYGALANLFLSVKAPPYVWRFFHSEILTRRQKMQQV